MVQFVDLKAQHDSLRRELFDAITNVIDNSAFIMGPAIKELEKNFADFCGCKHAIGCSSGTSALNLALWAIEVGPEDEVITIPHTFIATTEAICVRGAKPVFVDIDPATYTMDMSKLEAAITPKTKAIIPVHLYGHPTDMDPLLAIAKKHGLKVIEDCAQAHGAEYKGRRVGTMGDIGCFSFFPGKNIGAMGDAGAMTTNDDKLAVKLNKLRNHGRLGKYEHEMIGYNERIDNLQAAILNVKLPHLNDWNALRRKHAAEYAEALDGAGVGLPSVADGCLPVYHLFVIRHPDRDGLQKFLKEKGIATGVHYPLPLHMQPAHSDLGYKEGDFPETEKASKEIISLPMYPEMTAKMVSEVAEAIKEFSS
ncbi:MAG: DegT/DnrJ/EryC1/StrS family aminotransferase [Armatimonadetes bacterium]|jgi:dTDP-4-amino-4,6-dideoxygalactose transaminase|nr:DegT/DnrJ/EryC1/StrS family aminotransferase [Armatimonadota bacterium]